MSENPSPTFEEVIAGYEEEEFPHIPIDSAVASDFCRAGSSLIMAHNAEVARLPLDDPGLNYDHPAVTANLQAIVKLRDDVPFPRTASSLLPEIPGVATMARTVEVQTPYVGSSLLDETSAGDHQEVVSRVTLRRTEAVGERGKHQERLVGYTIWRAKDAQTGEPEYTASRVQLTDLPFSQSEDSGIMDAEPVAATTEEIRELATFMGYIGPEH